MEEDPSDGQETIVEKLGAINKLLRKAKPQEVRGFAHRKIVSLSVFSTGQCCSTEALHERSLEAVG